MLTFVGVLALGIAGATALSNAGVWNKPTAAAPMAKAGDQSLAERIATNPALASRLRALLPSELSVIEAAVGFSTETQLLTTLHLARRLDVPFTRLRTEARALDRKGLLGVVRSLRPHEDEHAVVRAAERLARADIEAAGRSRSPFDGGN
jgi:hypothetical protein